MKQKHIPLRKCIGCGLKKPKSEFVTVVRSPQNEQAKSFQILDGDIKKEGRGAYICKNIECFKKARKFKKIERTFKGKIDAQIYEILEKAVLSYE